MVETWRGRVGGGGAGRVGPPSDALLDALAKWLRLQQCRELPSVRVAGHVHGEPHFMPLLVRSVEGDGSRPAIASTATL